MKVYRICERRGGKLLTLFHSNDGSRVLPLNVWLNANVKPVRDGSRETAKEYSSGFHVFKDIDTCRSFIKRFKAPRELVLIECEVIDLRKKEHSPFHIFLAEKIKLLRVIEVLKSV